MKPTEPLGAETLGLPAPLSQQTEPPHRLRRGRLPDLSRAPPFESPPVWDGSSRAWRLLAVPAGVRPLAFPLRERADSGSAPLAPGQASRAGPLPAVWRQADSAAERVSRRPRVWAERAWARVPGPEPPARFLRGPGAARALPPRAPRRPADHLAARDPHPADAAALPGRAAWWRGPSTCWARSSPPAGSARAPARQWSRWSRRRAGRRTSRPCRPPAVR